MAESTGKSKRSRSQARHSTGDAKDEFSKAAEAFNASLGQTLAVSFANLDGTSLDQCPQDIKAPFTAYKYSLRDAADAFSAFQKNQDSQDSDCKAGVGLTIIEIVTGQDTGLTPCADNLSQGSSLKSGLDAAVVKLRSSETDLRTVFAAHGFTDKPASEAAPAT